MKVEKLKRNFWHSTEIECMLNLIKEMKSQEASVMTTHCTFTQIANKMKKRGFPNKSATQIRRKWFQMKSAYLCYKKGKVERLMLIPEKFRRVIAQLVLPGTERTFGRPNIASAATIKQKKKKFKATANLIDKFASQMRYNNAKLNKDFTKMQSALMHYEQKCQSIRDYNFTKSLNIRLHIHKNE